MTEIYSVAAASKVDQIALTRQWRQDHSSGLAAGYTNLVPIQFEKRTVLLAFNAGNQRIDAYALTATEPWVEADPGKRKLPSDKETEEPWDSLGAFVLGNVHYVYAYCRKTGRVGFFALHDDLSLSDPYVYAPSHTTPSAGFTTIAPYTSLGQQYLLGYDSDTGRVENISVSVTPSSVGSTPPLLAQNVWFHTWAKGWTHFAMFQLGGANFFFKINKYHVDKPDVNIDHMQDDPSKGSIEVGRHLQSQLPAPSSIGAAVIVPWAGGAPYLLTYIASTGDAALYAIHADCLGWTEQASTKTLFGAAALVPYRIGDTSYVLFYGGSSLETSVLTDGTSSGAPPM